LRIPVDPTDGNLTRSQVTAAIGAVNAQLRADEQQLRRKRTGDVLERLLKVIEEQKKIIEEEEKKKLPPSSSLEVPLRCNKLSMRSWNRARVRRASCVHSCALAECPLLGRT
jgi:hypothetical protein